MAQSFIAARTAPTRRTRRNAADGTELLQGFSLFPDTTGCIGKFGFSFPVAMMDTVKRCKGSVHY